MPDSAALTAFDIARLAGVTRATVSNWRRRHSDFPAPSGGTDASPAYDRDEVEAWLAARGALPELPLEERLWRHVRDAADQAGLSESVAWAARTLAESSGAGTTQEASLSRELAEAARKCGPADLLDSLIAKYAEASGGRISVTSRPVADLMAEIAGAGESIVLDPACGTGELLAAASRHGSDKLFGQEVDGSLAELTGIRLSLSRGTCDSEVTAGDSLRDDNFPDLVADAVLCHPPFGDRDWGQEELALDPRWEYGTPPKAEPELAWAQHALAHLRTGGRAVLIMPPAAASRASGRRIRAEMLRRGTVKAVIALDPGAIHPRHVGPHLWVLERPRDTSLEPRVLLIDSPERETVLTAWRSFSARDEATGESEPGVWRSVPVIDLLDDSVDMTPSRHVGARAPVASPAEAAGAVDASQARLRVALAALSDAFSAADCVPLDGELRWREVSVGDLAKSGSLEFHRAPSAARLNGGARMSSGDVLVPAWTAGATKIRVAADGDDGSPLGQGLHLIRPNLERLDPWFLAGFLMSPANVQRAKYGTSSMRIDPRRMTVPLLPLREQQRYGAAFQRVHDLATLAIEVADLAQGLADLLGKGLTQGALIPQNEGEN